MEFRKNWQLISFCREDVQLKIYEVFFNFDFLGDLSWGEYITVCILVQLAREEGLSHKIWEDKDGSLTLNEVHDFIQYFIDYLSQKGYSEADIIGVAQSLDMMFQLSAREKLEYCHRMIDCYAENLTPYIYTQQVLGLDNLAKKLAVESVCSTVNAAIHCGELAEVLKMGMELGDTDDVGDLYGDDEDPVCDEYMERDKQVLLYAEGRQGGKGSASCQGRGRKESSEAGQADAGTPAWCSTPFH